MPYFPLKAEKVYSSVISQSYAVQIINKMARIIAFAPLFLTVIATTAVAVETGSIYSLENLGAADSNETVSLIVKENGFVTVEASRVNEPFQRFIVRITTGTTFNLFLEVQPWNWVDYIVERSKTVNIIDKTPQVLDAVLQDGARVLVQKNYDGNDGQKWYVVPSGGSDGDIGLITNLLTRRCVASNGNGQLVTAEICNNNDPNQLWRLVSKDSGRCF